MKWSGLNHAAGCYMGPGLDVDDYLHELVTIVDQLSSWKLEWIPDAKHPRAIPMLTRGNPASGGGIYISAGIHGDEPAGPLSILPFLTHSASIPDIPLVVFPIINPSGFRLGTRENDRQSDMNREFRNPVSDEIRAIMEIITPAKIGPLKSAIFLHEDWEARGFYLYELRKVPGCDGHGRNLLNHLSEDPKYSWVPIDQSPEIDGREARDGLIETILEDHLDRPDWPEAFYFNSALTDITYTLESPSDLDLQSRVSILSRALEFLLSQY